MKILIYGFLVIKLSLNVTKTNFVIFHTPQKELPFIPRLYINKILIQKENYIKSLGINLDSNLHWKYHILQVSKKISKGIGVLTKIRHYINIHVLTQLCYTLIFPFLTHGVVVWGNTYNSLLKPLITLQKKAVRIMTFSNFREHSSPLFKMLNILKFPDLISYRLALFMSVITILIDIRGLSLIFLKKLKIDTTVILD